MLLHILKLHASGVKQIKYKDHSFIFSPSDRDWKELENRGLIDPKGQLTQKGKSFIKIPNPAHLPDSLLIRLAEKCLLEIKQRNIESAFTVGFVNAYNDLSTEPVDTRSAVPTVEETVVVEGKKKTRKKEVAE
jgi:HrpA-like RNA helicase